MKRVAVASVAIALAVALAILVWPTSDSPTPNSDDSLDGRGGASTPGTGPLSGRSRIGSAGSDPAVIGLAEDPPLSAESRRPGESDSGHRGRVMMLRAYRNWTKSAGLDEQAERAARQILADTQINVGYFFVAQDAPYEEWFAEVTQANGFRPEHLEWLKQLRDEPVSVGTIDEQAISRLRDVVTPEQLETFEQTVGSPFAFANMAPFDIPTPGFIGEHIVTAGRR